MGAPSGTIDVAPVERGPYGDGPGYLFGWFITSYFGGRIDPLTGRAGTHGGMDIAYPGCTGAPIIAPISGLLSQGWDSSGGGNWSGISGHNGDYWGFGHASRFQWPAGGSRWVEAGDVIAYVGTTGGSTGPHLHIAYRPAGASSYRDPYDALATAGAGQPTPPDVQEDLDMTADELSVMLDEKFKAERNHNYAIRDQAVDAIVHAIVAADADNATEAQVTQKRDELLAVIKPQLDRIDA